MIKAGQHSVDLARISVDKLLHDVLRGKVGHRPDRLCGRFYAVDFDSQARAVSKFSARGR